MRIYEELFILRPDAPEEEIDQLIEQLTTLIASNGGNVDKSEKWGVRKLAYRVQKRTEGFYVLLQFTRETGNGAGNRAAAARHGSGDEVPDGSHR